MKNLLFIPIMFLLFNCVKTESNKEAKNNKKTLPISNIKKFDINDQSLKTNLENAILKGDTLVYKKYYKEYLINGNSKEFLYYAVLMAEKNNYKRAYLDIATILDFSLNDSLAYHSKYATYSLLKAYEMGDKGAKGSVNYIYVDKNKPIPRSSSIYK